LREQCSEVFGNPVRVPVGNRENQFSGPFKPAEKATRLQPRVQRYHPASGFRLPATNNKVTTPGIRAELEVVHHQSSQLGATGSRVCRKHDKPAEPFWL